MMPGVQPKHCYNSQDVGGSAFGHTQLPSVSTSFIDDPYRGVHIISLWARDSRRRVYNDDATVCNPYTLRKVVKVQCAFDLRKFQKTSNACHAADYGNIGLNED